MVKDIATILKELGINLESETLLEDTINKLLEYSVVNENELLGIQNVSVQPLPTIIKNDEKNLKQRMVGIVSDQEKGAVSIINKRTVLLTKIIEALKNKVESFTDLGEIDVTPANAVNEELNNITIEGAYVFKWSGFTYLMLVRFDVNKKGEIIYQYIFDGSRIIVRRTNDSIDYWTVETNHIASKSDLDETKQEILNTLDTRLGNFKWLGIINENIHQSNVPILNSVVEEGFYAFGIPDGMGGSAIEFMTVSKVTTNSTRIIQHIFSTDALFFTDDAKKVDYYISHTIRILSNNVWSVHFENIITGPTIDAKITTIKNEIIGNVSSDYNNLGKIEQKLKSQGNSIDTKAEKTYVDEKFNQILGEGASETLDTIGEIAQAIKQNADVIQALNNSISNKADKEEIENIKKLLDNLKIYDFVVSVNPYVKEETLYLDSANVDDTTLTVRNSSVNNDTTTL